MKTSIYCISNKLRNGMARSPRFSEFSAELTDEMKDVYRGRTAELFFENKHHVAHKWLHYLAIYDQLLTPFVGQNIKMLEIGVSKGGSLDIWRKFLGENALLFGIDIDPQCAAYDGKSAQVRIGSQDDAAFLHKVVDEMGGVDVVLDDGSHVSSHQRASFDVLFPLLSQGGLYIIEDMHTAYWHQWEGGVKIPGTAIEFLKNKIDEMHLHYRKAGLNKPESMTEIESIQFFDSIAVLKKRKQLPRYHVEVPSPRSATGTPRAIAP